MRRFFQILTVLAAIGWGVFYLYIQELACAFGSPGGDCRIQPPWELRGEDVMIMLVMPGMLVGFLALLAWWPKPRG